MEMLDELLGIEAREMHISPTASLRLTDHKTARHLDGALCDGQPATQDIDSS
jgi:hypothetical protein